jgi:hypothetical protein
MMTKRPDENAAGVVAIGLGPGAKQRREITGIAGHEDAALSGRELQDLRIVQGAQRGVRREAEHVVATPGQDCADALG